MEAGRKVYRGTVYSAITDCSRPWYMQEAQTTGLELDGKPLVRLHNLLCPGDEWLPTEADAKRAVVRELVRHIGQLQAVVDGLKDDILHADLTKEATA